MTTVTRSQFQNLSRNGGYLDVDNMPSSLRQAFQDKGITDEQLRDIAGQDGVIRGNNEFGELFDRIDELDTNGSRSSIATSSGGRQTDAGRVFEAARQAVEANRARAAREGGRRFAGNSTLERVANGRGSFEQGARGDHVRIVQQALIDVGALSPNHGVTGTYDRATTDAVRRFQRDAGIGIDGDVGPETLSALASSAPPPGQSIERRAEFDRMYADGRLDVTIAIGYDENNAHQGTERGVASGLRADGYRMLSNPPSAADRQRYGLDGNRYDANADFWVKTFTDPNTGEDVDAVVRVISPRNGGAEARASYEQALQQDEVVMYNGHARYGTGPDFDDINSGAGNFVVDEHGNRRHARPPAGLRQSIRGRRTDLGSLSQRPDYQLMIMNGCSTEEYLHNMRDPSTFNASMSDTDIIATQAGPRFMWSGQPAMRFLSGLTSRESNNSMLADQATAEVSYLRARNMPDSEVTAAQSTFVESGFLENDANRRVQSQTSP